MSKLDHFGCIGAGAYIADPALYQRLQSRALGLGKTLYHVYEAKRLGEIADGVGWATIIIVIEAPPPGKEGPRLMLLSKEGKQFLERTYKKYGLKSTATFQWPKAKMPLSDAEKMKLSAKSKKYL